MKQFFLSLALVLAGGAALAQTVEAPKYKQGESWTYRVVNEKGPDRHEGMTNSSFRASAPTRSWSMSGRPGRPSPKAR